MPVVAGKLLCLLMQLGDGDGGKTAIQGTQGTHLKSKGEHSRAIHLRLHTPLKNWRDKVGEGVDSGNLKNTGTATESIKQKGLKEKKKKSHFQGGAGEKRCSSESI